MSLLSQLHRVTCPIMRYTPAQGFITVVMDESIKCTKLLPAKQKNKEDNRQVYINEHTGDKKKSVNTASV